MTEDEPAHAVHTIRHDESAGLGVGFAIARTIVDTHGGTIDAHDNPEGGATFIVTLRCQTPKSLSGPPSSA